MALLAASDRVNTVNEKKKIWKEYVETMNKRENEINQEHLKKWQ